MGSMFLILPQKIYPLWISPLLPIFFLVSSVAVGLCMAIVESYFSHKIFGRSLDLPLLRSLAVAAAIILWAYVALKLVDVFYRQQWSALTRVPLLGASFLIEVVLGAALPATLFLVPSYRMRPRRLLYGALLVGVGVLLNRINVSWFSMIPYSQMHYFPSWMEINISLFIVSVTVMAFALAVRYLPVFERTKSIPTSVLNG